MIEQLGDTDTEEELLKGLKLMNRQEDKCQVRYATYPLPSPLIIPLPSLNLPFALTLRRLNPCPLFTVGNHGRSP